MIAIAAVDENFGIGYKGDLLVRIPEDMKRFRKLTTGNVVVYGRNTLAGFPNGKPLRNQAGTSSYPATLISTQKMLLSYARKMLF